MRQSESEQTLTFSAAPADVATAIEAALASVGEVKQVDQATGRIAGKIKQGLHGFDSAAMVEFLVSSSGAMTQVQIQTTRDEGAISMHGAEKGMDIILAALQAQPGLKGTSSAGW